MEENVLKRLLLLIISTVMIFGAGQSAWASTLDKHESYVLDQLSGKEFSEVIEPQYINQLRNYFLRDDVSLEKIDADDFLDGMKDIASYLNDSKDKNSLAVKADLFVKHQKAGSALGLIIEYDSVVNRFYGIDKEGYIVIDTAPIIKNTDDSDDEDKSWNISIEAIFAFAVSLCVIGIAINLRRWNKKIRKKHKDSYDDEEFEDELEVADRKTRKARLNTLSYRSVKQVLKYFYIPIIMGLIVIGIGYLVSTSFSDYTDSIMDGFINTQPLYNKDDSGFMKYSGEEKNQQNEIDATSKDFAWPKYSEQCGMLECNELNLSTTVFFGDRGNLLEKGAGLYSGSSLPGTGGTILVGAHDTTYFQGLEKVKKGNEFIFTTEYGIYRYKVTDTKIVAENEYDTAYDLTADEEQLVLYTCYPFGKFTGDKTDRMFVYLEKVSGPNLIVEEVSK